MIIYVDASTGACCKGSVVGVGFVVKEGDRLYHGAVRLSNDGTNPEQQAVDYILRVFPPGCVVFNDLRGIKGAEWMSAANGSPYMKSAHYLARMVNLTIKSNVRARRQWERAAKEGDAFEIKKSRPSLRNW